MKLEVGKKYKDRRGNMVEITAFRDQLTKYPFVGCNHETYTKSGTWDKHGESDKDLIEELNMLHLEVGKKYKTKAGIVVEIIKIDAQYGDFRFIGKEEGLDHEGRYRSCGEHVYYTRSRLIEEIDEDIKDKSFKSVQEIYAYLGAGGIIKVKNNAIIYYFENDELTREYIKDDRKETQRDKEILSEIMIAIFDIDIFEKYERPVIKNWDDEIPEQGILCVVETRDGGRDFTSLAIIVSVEGTYYRCDSGFLWDDANPATLEDLKQYLYETK